MKKRFLTLSLVICLFFTLSSTVFAEDAAPDVYQSLLPNEVSYDITFGQIEEDISNYISVYGLNIEYNSEEFASFMDNISWGQLEYVDETTLTYFEAYASQFLNVDDISACREVTILDVRNENIEKERLAKAAALENPQTRGSVAYNIAGAKAYAKEWALSNNLTYPFYAQDCTNFASQILHFGGGVPRNTRWDYLGLTIGNELAYTTWVNANDFTCYWSLERGCLGPECTTRSQVNSSAEPGDFLGHRNLATFNITHVQFVQSKSSGYIYCSQHTDHYYNLKFNDRVSDSYFNNHTVVVVDFT